jgi:hypothetical protein
MQKPLNDSTRGACQGRNTVAIGHFLQYHAESKCFLFSYCRIWDQTRYPVQVAAAISSTVLAHRLDTQKRQQREFKLVYLLTMRSRYSDIPRSIRQSSRACGFVSLDPKSFREVQSRSLVTKANRVEAADHAVAPLVTCPSSSRAISARRRPLVRTSAAQQ